MNGKAMVNLGAATSVGGIIAWGVAAAVFIVLFVYLNNIMQDPRCKDIEPHQRQFLYIMSIIEFVVLGISLLGAIWWTITLQIKKR
jgi:hypothetical protein